MVEKRADIKRLIEKSTNPQAASLGVLTSLGKELPKDVKKLIAKNLGIRVKDINKILKSNIFEKWNKENPKYESEELKIPDGYAADNADAMRMRREGMEIVNLIPGTNRVDVKKYQEVANKAVKSQQRRIQRNKDLRSVKRKDGTDYMTHTHRSTRYSFFWMELFISFKLYNFIFLGKIKYCPKLLWFSKSHRWNYISIPF